MLSDDGITSAQAERFFIDAVGCFIKVHSPAYSSQPVYPIYLEELYQVFKKRLIDEIVVEIKEVRQHEDGCSTVMITEGTIK